MAVFQKKLSHLNDVQFTQVSIIRTDPINHKYFSDFWWIVLFIFITELLFLIYIVFGKKWILLYILITVLFFPLYALFSKTRPVTYISTGLIIGTQEYVLSQCYICKGSKCFIHTYITYVVHFQSSQGHIININSCTWHLISLQ